MPADGKVGIGDPMPPESNANLNFADPMPSVPDPNLQIELYRHWLPSVTECPRLIPDPTKLCPLYYRLFLHQLKQLHCKTSEIYFVLPDGSEGSGGGSVEIAGPLGPLGPLGPV
jgi:hypothetical protein